MCGGRRRTGRPSAPTRPSACRFRRRRTCARCGSFRSKRIRPITPTIATIVEPFFQRAKDPAMIAQVEALIDGMLTEALGRESIEIVNEFALPRAVARAHLPAQRAGVRGGDLDRLGHPCFQGHRRRVQEGHRARGLPARAVRPRRGESRRGFFQRADAGDVSRTASSRARR